MFAVRFVVLLFLAAYGYSMGQYPPHELNGFGKLAAMSFFVIAPALYLLPTLEAWKRDHPNISSIAAVNVLLGWSVLGWVVAEAWALRRSEPVTAEAPKQERETKKCPYCAEDVLAEAIKCKHCGSGLT